MFARTVLRHFSRPMIDRLVARRWGYGRRLHFEPLEDRRLLASDFGSQNIISTDAYGAQCVFAADVAALKAADDGRSLFVDESVHGGSVHGRNGVSCAQCVSRLRKKAVTASMSLSGRTSPKAGRRSGILSLPM